MNNWKRLLSFLLTLVMLAGITPVHASAWDNITGGGTFELVCDHEWGPKQYSDETATCVSPRSWWQICTKCDDGRDGEEYGPHQWGPWVTTVEATCTSGGKQVRGCSLCEAEESRSTEKQGHDYGSWFRRGIPTCTEPGLKCRICERCGNGQFEDIPPTGHNMGEWYVVAEAQVGLPGLEQRDCTNGCGTFEQRDIPALEQDFGDAPVALSGLSLTLKLTSTPANGQYFVVGEEVVFTEHWANNSSETLYPFYVSIWPYEQPTTSSADLPYSCSWDAEETGPVAPGASGSHSLVTTVTEEDVARGGIYAMAFISASVHNGPEVEEVSTPFVTAPCGAGEVDLDGLTVTKSAAEGSHMNYYYPGEEVLFTITVTNNTGVELRDVEITDPLKGSNEDAIVDRILSLQPEESVTVTFTYTTTEEDAAIGTESFENTAYATGYTADGTQVNGTSNTVRVWCVIPHELGFSKSVVNTPANGEFFVPGESIEFAISMTNDTPYPLYCVTLTDPLCEDQYIYDAINDMSYLYFDSLYRDGNPMGYSSSATVNVKYVVTEADAEAGSVTNTAHLWYQTWYGEEKTASASATAKCGKASDAVILEKIDMRSPANGEYYVPGEMIKYGLTVRSTEENPLQNIIIYDPLKGGDQVVFGPADAWVLGAGFYYTVTEADAQRGYVENTGYATFTYQNTGEEGMVYSNTLTLPCGFAKDAGLSGVIAFTKGAVAAPQNEMYYVPGETIPYQFALYNWSDVTLKELTFVDPLIGSGSWDQLAPGEFKFWEIDYEVTELDAMAGRVENIAYVNAFDEADNQYVEYSNPVSVPCGFIEGSDVPFGTFADLAIIKQEESLPLNGSYYTAGEEIHYRITYTNAGELPMIDVEIFDHLGGLHAIASAEKLEPGESRTCTFVYTVTVADTLAGYVSNYASGIYMVSDYTGSATSNRVVSDTSPDEYYWSTTVPGPSDGTDPKIPVLPLPPGYEKPYWTPDVGFSGIEFDPSTVGEVVTPSYFSYSYAADGSTGFDPSVFGLIDTASLCSGEASCVRTITARDNASVSYEVSYCANHADTQTSVMMMTQAGTTPEMQMQAAAYAVALWRSEVESLYEELYNASDSQAKAILMTEYIRFVAEAANFESLLKALYPDQPAMVAQKLAAMWQDKCVSLCYEMHTPAAEHKDSLLNVNAAAGASATICSCVTTGEETGRQASAQTYCPMHSFPFSMIDMLLKGNDTVEAWTTVRQIWGVELANAYNKVADRLGENSALATAEYATLTQWMIAREAALIALYPDNPELVAQTMLKLIMEHVNDLCLTGK